MANIYYYKVHNIRYMVVFMDISDRTNNKSYIQYSTRIIYINNTLPHIETIKHCLIHEITHSYIYETQIQLKEPYSEEDLCELMAIYAEDIIKQTNTIIKKYKKAVKNEDNKT